MKIEKIESKIFNTYEEFEVQYDRVKNIFFGKMGVTGNKRLPNRIVLLRGKNIKDNLYYNLTDGTKGDMKYYINQKVYKDFILIIKEGEY